MVVSFSGLINRLNLRDFEDSTSVHACLPRSPQTFGPDRPLSVTLSASLHLVSSFASFLRLPVPIFSTIEQPFMFRNAHLLHLCMEIPTPTALYDGGAVIVMVDDDEPFCENRMRKQRVSPTPNCCIPHSIPCHSPLLRARATTVLSTPPNQTDRIA